MADTLQISIFGALSNGVSFMEIRRQIDHVCSDPKPLFLHDVEREKLLAELRQFGSF